MVRLDTLYIGMFFCGGYDHPRFTLFNRCVFIMGIPVRVELDDPQTTTFIPHIKMVFYKSLYRKGLR